MTADEQLTQLHEVLLGARDEKRAAAMSAYMKNRFPFLGIAADQRRNLTRPFLAALKKDAQLRWDIVFDFYEQPWREYHYLANDYLTLKKKAYIPDDLPNFSRLIQYKSWWDTVDAFHSLIGGTVLRFPELKTLMRAWSLSENIWLRRSAVIHQLSLKKQTDTSLFSEILLNNIEQKEFFIAKAVGWSLREYSKTDREWVADFVARNRDRMLPLSIHEASKYLAQE